MKAFTIFSLLPLVITATATVVASDGWLSVDSIIVNADGSVNKTLAGSANGANIGLKKRYGAEIVTCYNIGTKMPRAAAISVIDDWCNNHAYGQYVQSGQTIMGLYNYGTFTVLVSGQAINGCSWGPIAGTCNSLLRLPLDGCNINDDNRKQGGYETDLCGQWRLDAGTPGTDL